MSREKDNELNEQELWDLLKDHEETDLPKPEKKKPVKKTEPVEEEKPKTVITERRKKALVWYLVGLFGIAFLVVLLSLFLRGGDGQTPSTDSTGDNSAQVQQMQELYDRINELEDKNAELQALNRDQQKKILEQQEMMDGLNLMIDELSNSLEYVEGSQYMDADAQAIARKISAYETLVKAQAAFIDYDEAALEKAMGELGENLDLLSQEAINAYYMITEYMEQPYLGQE